MPLILEGIVTTTNADGQPNISPMGPIVEPDLRTLILRPYQTSTTFQNLKRTGVGIFHVVDNVNLLARAAIGKLKSCGPWGMHPTRGVQFHNGEVGRFNQPMHPTDNPNR